MDFSEAFFWLAVAASLMMLLRLGRRALGPARSWALKSVLVLVVALGSTLLVPDAAGWITFGLWAAIVFVPSLLAAFIPHSLAAEHFVVARACGRLMRVLHPFDGWPAYDEAVAALHLAHRGYPERAIARLSELLACPGLSWHMRENLRLQLYRIAGDWEGILTAAPFGDGVHGLARLRALGETGDLHELVAEVVRLERAPDAGLPVAELYVLAFCGRGRALAGLLDGALARLRPEAKRFWLATAALAAGEIDAAAREFERLASDAADRTLAAHAARRLRDGLGNPADALDDDDWRAIAAIEAAAPGRPRVARSYLSFWRGCYVIGALVACNFAVFALEIWRGGSENEAVLAQLGAMWAGAIIEGGEWWRLGAATFLHLGFLHIGFNMAALAVLGPWVERRIGHWRTLAVYLLSGLASTAGVLLLIEMNWVEDEFLVGASGAIFGLVGAHLVLRAQSWLHHRSAEAAQRLGDMVWGIALQVVFDFTAPQVSFAGHAWGLGAGLLVTLLLSMGGWRRATG
jgi:rhomboid protease GluP